MEIIINIKTKDEEVSEDEYVLNEKWKFVKEEKEDKSKVRININENDE